MPTSTVKPTKRSRRSPERSKGAKGDFEGLGVEADVDHLMEEEEDRNARNLQKLLGVHMRKAEIYGRRKLQDAPTRP